MEPNPQIPKNVVEWIQYGALAGFGGMANYLYLTVMKGKRFMWAMFSANIFIAFFVGNLVGRVVPASNEYKDGIIMACGYCAFPLLAVIEFKVREWALKFGVK